ncbi:MAG: hypothetical protein AAF682_03185 [Planctomycetota bacterium]
MWSSKPLLVFALIAGSVGSLVLTGGEASESKPVEPASTPMAATMLRVGLGADALAAAGLSASDAAGAIAKAVAEHDSHVPSLPKADAQYAACKPVCDALERKIKSGKDGGTDVSDYKAGIAELASLEAARKGVLDNVFAAGVAGLSAAQRATLETVRANRRWRLATQYLAKDRTEAQWVELRDMLDARRIYAEDGEAEPKEVTAYLAGVDGDAGISAAKASLDANLASVQTAWNAAVTD